MTNRSKQKGTAAERALVDYLRSEGFGHAERRALEGVNDRGDIAGIPHTVIEVKDCKTLALASYVDEAEVERVNARSEYGVAWHKRKGKGSPGDWYVTMSGRMFVRLLKAALLGIERHDTRSLTEPTP